MAATDSRLLKTFGRSVRAARKRQGVPQESLAEKARLSRNYISDIERGIRNPSLIAVVRIARALRMKLAELLADIEAR